MCNKEAKLVANVCSVDWQPPESSQGSSDTTEDACPFPLAPNDLTMP